MLKKLVVTCFCLFVVISIVQHIWKREAFTNVSQNDTSSYLHTVSIPWNAYDELGIGNPYSYYIEMNDASIKSVMEKCVHIYDIDTSASKNILTTLRVDARDMYVQQISKELLDCLNENATTNNKFRVVRTELHSVTKDANNDKLNVIESDVAVHQYGKAYGFVMNVKTVHDIEKDECDIIDVHVNGYAFDDTLSLTTLPFNFEEDNHMKFDDLKV
jgi:L-fucose mutarotase/ribose pyranase (RbsD/FucU family)